MLYRLIRWIAKVALEWFYRDIEVVGAERIPHQGPLLLAVNHPNSLIDAMVVLRVVPRRVRLTAKATLYDHALLRPLLSAFGVIPLRRSKDEKGATGATPDRNAGAFRAVLDTLGAGQAVLIFPEGISHSQPQLAPLRTGLARLALQARDDRGVRGLTVVPIGLVFEEKGAPRSRILVTVGEPLAMDDWERSTADPQAEVAALTAEVDRRLRAATLNFPSAEEASRVLGVARLLSGLFDRPRPLGTADTPLAAEVTAVRRVEAAWREVPADAAPRVERFLERLEALRAELARRRIPPNEIALSPDVAPGARFVLREGAIVATTWPVALWGRVNHWLPLRAALTLSGATSKHPEDPAMHTVVAGVAFTLGAYAAQTALVWQLAGARWALPYLLSLPASATWDLRFRDRMRSAIRRVRTYLQFRRDPSLQPRLVAELAWIREEALALEELTTREPVLERR